MGTDPCLHARMCDVSYLCVMSGPQTLIGDDDDDLLINSSCNDVLVQRRKSLESWNQRTIL